jgi:hypothetical protein
MFFASCPLSPLFLLRGRPYNQPLLFYAFIRWPMAFPARVVEEATPEYMQRWLWKRRVVAPLFTGEEIGIIAAFFRRLLNEPADIDPFVSRVKEASDAVLANIAPGSGLRMDNEGIFIIGDSFDQRTIIASLQGIKQFYGGECFMDPDLPEDVKLFAWQAAWILGVKINWTPERDVQEAFFRSLATGVPPAVLPARPEPAPIPAPLPAQLPVSAMTEALRRAFERNAGQRGPVVPPRIVPPTLIPPAAKPNPVSELIDLQQPVIRLALRHIAEGYEKRRVAAGDPDALGRTPAYYEKAKDYLVKRMHELTRWLENTRNLKHPPFLPPEPMVWRDIHFAPDGSVIIDAPVRPMPNPSSDRGMSYWMTGGEADAARKARHDQRRADRTARRTESLMGAGLPMTFTFGDAPTNWWRGPYTASAGAPDADQPRMAHAGHDSEWRKAAARMEEAWKFWPEAFADGGPRRPSGHRMNRRRARAKGL